MTSRERALSTLKNKRPDRPPVGFWFHFPQEKALGEPCVQAHLDYYNHSDVDLVKIMCDGYFDYPNPVAKSAQKPEDWYAMKPLGRKHPFLREQVERAKAIKAGLRNDKYILYNVFAPFSSIRFATSDELITRHLNENPSAVLYALDVIARDAAELCDMLMKEAGIDGVYYCVQGGEENRMTVDTYRRLISPSDLYVLSRANLNSAGNILHCCGWAGVPNHLEDWRDYPAACVNWACYVENMPLRAGKRFFGDKCVLGGFDNRKMGALYAGTRAQVEEKTRELISSMEGEEGYILGADCTLPSDIPLERLDWVIQAAK